MGAHKMTVDIATLAIRIDSLEARAAARDLDQLGGAGGRAERSASTLTGVMKGLGSVLAVLKIMDIAKDAAMLAARYETLGVTMRVAGNNAGYTNAQMQAFQKTLQQTGISMTQSRNSLIQLATANLDLAKSQELARTAQNLAVVANINSSEALESLIHGIKSAETEVLQTLGLNVKFEAGYKTLAVQLGTTSDKLTEQQKLIARTNLVLAEAAKYNGIYEESLTTAGKALGSLSRYWEDFKVKAGEVFLPALTDAVFKLTDALKEMNVAANDAKQIGDLDAIGRGIGAAFKYAYEAVAILAANFVFTFATIGREIGAMAAAAAAAVQGDFGLIPGIFNAADEASAAARTGLDAFEKKILDTADATVKLADKNKLSAEQMEAARIAAGKASRDKQEADEKALKAADDAEKAKKKAAEAYAAAIKSAKDYIAALKIETSEVGLGADQIKMMEAARAAAKAPTAELRMQIMQSALALDIETKAFAASEAAKKSVADATQVLVESRAGEYMAIAAEVQANKDAIATYGMSKAAIEALTLAKMEERLARRGPQDLDLDEAEANHLMRIIALQKEKAATTTTLELLDTGSSVTKAKELLDILVAVDNAAKSAAQGMAASFGTVGTAIGGLTTALTDYAVQQQAVAAQLAAVKADPKSSADKIAKAEMAASKASAQAQIKSYGDMAAAGKSFFKENSKGYKLLETTEKAFRAYEMAMAVESMVKKIFFKEGEVAANLALNATKLTGEAATTGASVALAGTEASAWGITAVVKAMASLPFPLNLAAGAVTLAAVLALGAKVMGGGGSGMSVSQQRQESQGTGTVFGDSTAKSDSIARSLELVSSNSSIELSYTQGMLNSLRAIESSLGGLGNLLVRSTGITSATSNIDVGGSGGWVGKIATGIFGGKTSVQDTGFTLDRTTLGSAAAGDLNSYSYADMKKSGGWFSSGKSWTDKTELGAAADAQFAKVLAGLGAGVSEAAKLLGVGGDAFTQRLNSFVIDIGKISLKDLSGTEIQEQLEAVFSKVGDDLAQFGVAGLEQFQQVGEGYFETLTRIATNYANLDSILASSGTSFGQVGMASIAARERLIALAGGIDDLASMQSSFNDNFLTEAERLAPVQKYVTDQLAALGLQGIDTRDKFKDVVLGLANSGALATEAGAAQYAALLALADAFAKTHAATEDLTKSEQEIVDERKDLLQQLDEITKSEAELLAIQRAGIADVNKALFDQVQAAKAVVSAKDALATAYDKEAAAAKTAIEKSKAWVTTLNGLNANLALGNQSTLTPEQKYAEARAQFEKTLAAANAGDTTAQSGLSAAEQAFLTASQVVNASDAKYAADYARVVAANEEAIKWASAQVDLQQASYDALEAQVKGLININDSVLTVAQAIANLQKAMGVSDGLGVKFTEVPAVTAMVASAAPAIDYSRYSAASNAGSDALVAEIRGLREDNKVLQEKVERQTAVLARVTAESNAKAAETVVGGVEKSAKASAWSSTVKGEYA